MRRETKHAALFSVAVILAVGVGLLIRYTWGPFWSVYVG